MHVCAHTLAYGHVSVAETAKCRLGISPEGENKEINMLFNALKVTITFITFTSVTHSQSKPDTLVLRLCWQCF